MRPQDRKYFQFLMAIVGSAIFSACTSPGPTAPSNSAQSVPTGGLNPPPFVTSFDITAAPPFITVGQILVLPSPSATFLWAVVGQSSQLRGTVALSNGTVQDVTEQVTWQAYGPLPAATVSSTGFVTTHRTGQALISATYQGPPAYTVLLTSFNSPITTIESFKNTLGPNGRHSYLLTIGPGGRDITYFLVSSAPSVNRVLLMFGSAPNGSTCARPFNFGSSFGGSTGSPTSAQIYSSTFEVSTGSYCLTLVDPAALTEQDGAPPFFRTDPITGPVDYTLTVGISGSGGAVLPAAAEH